MGLLEDSVYLNIVYIVMQDTIKTLLIQDSTYKSIVILYMSKTIPRWWVRWILYPSNMGGYVMVPRRWLQIVIRRRSRGIKLMVIKIIKGSLLDGCKEVRERLSSWLWDNLKITSNIQENKIIRWGQVSGKLTKCNRRGKEIGAGIINSVNVTHIRRVKVIK